VRLNISRLLIALVLLWNLQCALAFLAWPGNYTPGFELTGALGEAMIRGMGVLFLMWNVPYAVAFINPIKHRLSLWEAVIMQAIGMVGETLILVGLPPEHAIARQSILRFIVFDLAGLVCLLLAAWVSRFPNEQGE